MWALIHRQEGSKDAVSCHGLIQWGQAILHLALSAVTYPVIESFFSRRVALVMMAMTAGRVVQSLGITSRALLEKELQYTKVSRANAIAASLSFVSLVILVRSGFGYWSIVLASGGTGIIYLAVQAAGYFLQRPVVFNFRVSPETLKWYLAYCKPVWLQQQTTAFVQQFDRFIVGTMLGTQALGMYEVAMRYARYPCTLIMFMVSRLTLPVYAKLQSKASQLAAVFTKVFGYAFRLSLPVYLSLFWAAPEAIRILAGEGWEETVAIFRILILFSFFRSFCEEVTSFTLATGRGKLLAKIFLSTTAVIVVFVPVFTWLWDLPGAAWGMSLGWAWGLALGLFYISQFISLELKQIMGAPLLASILPLLLFPFLAWRLEIGTVYLSLVIKTIVVFFVFGAALLVLEKDSIFREANAIRSQFRS